MIRGLDASTGEQLARRLGPDHHEDHVVGNAALAIRRLQGDLVGFDLNDRLIQHQLDATRVHQTTQLRNVARLATGQAGATIGHRHHRLGLPSYGDDGLHGDITSAQDQNPIAY